MKVTSSREVRRIHGAFRDLNVLCIHYLLHYEYLFDQIDTRLQIHTEINEIPTDLFSLVLFLFENEHMVVIKLLEFFIRVVYAQLIEAIKL